jgi:hypothetical protein
MQYSSKEVFPHRSDVSMPLTTQREEHSRLIIGSPLPPQLGAPTMNGQHADGVDEVNETDDGPEMLYTRMAVSEPDEQQPEFSSANVRSFYMGESFSLSCIVKNVCNPSDNESEKLHYPIPTTVVEHAQDAAEGRNDSDPVTLAYLNMRGAFTVPPQEISDDLVRIFFQCFHPAFPVIDRQAFCSDYQQGRMSLLILHTVYFLSFTLCSESLVMRAGFSDRYNARRTYYLRAKALYDMDYEKDKIKLTAVLFLLGFWWEGPEDQKDIWHWLGTAISLAQTLGMHRS